MTLSQGTDYLLLSNFICVNGLVFGFMANKIVYKFVNLYTVFLAPSNNLLKQVLKGADCVQHLFYLGSVTTNG